MMAGLKITRLLCVVSVSVLLMPWHATFSAAATVSLPRSGQTTCYDGAGNSIPCSATGQDGELRPGVVWPMPRFAGNGDGTVTDTLTGLTWTQNANGPGPVACGGGQQMTWGNALAYTKCLNNNSYLGKSDWRLPNIFELNTLVNSGQSSLSTWLNNSGSDSPGFTNVQAGLYLSSTSGPSLYGSRTDYGINMSAGIETHSYSYPGSVWPVRGDSAQSAALAKPPQTGQQKCYDPLTSIEIGCTGTGQDGELRAGIAAPSPRFTGDASTITDNLTGLQWLKDGTNQSFGTCGKDAMDWQDSLDVISCLNQQKFLGYSDWRMPAITELLSLFNPASDDVSVWLTAAGFNLNVNSLGYWSSTTALASSSINAKTVNFSFLGVFSPMEELKSVSNFLMPVRTAQNTGQSSNVPNPFVFASLNNVPLATTIVSAPVTISGLIALAPVSISNGEFSLDSGATWKKSSDTGLTISNGQQVLVRHNSSTQLNTQTITTLTISGVNGTFTSKTVSVARSMGDVSGTGGVDVSDALLALKSVVGIQALTAEQRLWADMNHDGLINIADAILILAKAVNL